MLAPEPLAELLPALFDGPFEDPLWATFLDRFRLATDASYTAITFRPPGKPLNNVVHLYSGVPCPPAPHEFYHEHLYAVDPVPHYRLQEGRPYPLDELLRPDDPICNIYYQDFLVPSGMNSLCMMRVKEATGVNAWLTICREGPDFQAHERALMGAIAPYLRQALRSFVALERERFNASVAGEAVRRLDFGWITLDASGRVIDADSAADGLLRQSGVLRRCADGRLTASSRTLERELRAAVQALSAHPPSRPRAIVLSRDPWLDMLLISTQKRSISAKPDPVIIAYIHGDSWSSVDRCEQLAELFGLTASEARLAVALSCGMTIAEAAAELGLTVGTARNYSKKIFAKLGARGQPDVVRFIMRSVLAIA